MDSDISDKLPGTISSILPQKNNRDRYSIFVDDAFVIGVSESTLLEHQLGKGVELTASLLEKLRKAEGVEKIKSYCLGMLARRDHSRKELFDKARKKGFPGETVTRVLDRLQSNGYLDDRTFARNFVSDKSKLNNWGPAKIKSHLYKKGISSSVAEESIEEVFGAMDVDDKLFELVEKKRRRFLREEDRFKRKKKIFDYLRRKGYRTGSIMKILDELTDSIE